MFQCPGCEDVLDFLLSEHYDNVHFDSCVCGECGNMVVNPNLTPCYSN